MAGDANGGHLIGDAQKVAQLVVVRIVACRAVDLAMRTERQLPTDHLRRAYLAVRVGKRPIVAESNRVVVGKVVG